MSWWKQLLPMRARGATLESKIGYAFRDPEHLRRALTHKSATQETSPGAALADNELYEFLGDAVLGFLASEHLLHHHPTMSEGELSRQRANLVCESHLFEVAKSLQLGEHLLLGKGEERSGGRTKRTILADTVEALIAALYQDGGMDAARAFVLSRVLNDANPGSYLPDTALDFKSALQERCQLLRLPMPEYLPLHESGPDHNKHFIVTARVGHQWSAEGEGRSKKIAQQRAAESLLKQLPNPHAVAPR